MKLNTHFMRNSLSIIYLCWISNEKNCFLMNVMNKIWWILKDNWLNLNNNSHFALLCTHILSFVGIYKHESYIVNVRKSKYFFYCSKSKTFWWWLLTYFLLFITIFLFDLFFKVLFKAASLFWSLFKIKKQKLMKKLVKAS